MLCTTIKKDSLKAIDEANRKADLIELRLDLFTPPNLTRLRRACKKPVIFKVDQFDSTLLSYSPDFIDLPFEISVDLPVPRICSFHDEKKTPDLPSLFEKMQSCPADYYKIATYAETTVDALRMLQFVQEKKCIGLCMGERGIITRILAPVFEVPWTYAPLTEEQQTAPGQLLLDELVNTYHYSSLSKKTALYGLIGDPVSGSVSHKTHNFAFEELGLDAVYVKMPVKKEELSFFLPLCQQLGFSGLSITTPLKESICEGEAINTIGFGKKIERWNSDGVGALNALEKKGGSVVDKQIVILGAGGAAKAIAKEAKKRGAKVIIANRTIERAEKLAQAVGGEALGLDQFASQGYDILINCTTCSPISLEDLLEKRVVMDIIVNPKKTPLLQAAEAKGCLLVYGLEMFIQQAIEQYCYWFLTENKNEKMESCSL